MIDPIATLLGSWATELNAFSVILRISLSLLLSAYLGFERSSKRHAAGLRTFMVVSLATTIAMLLDLYLLRNAESGFYLISAASIISIAIITVNSILYSSRSQIKGLTTSVALWASAILGLCLGAGLYTVIGKARGSDIIQAFAAYGDGYSGRTSNRRRGQHTPDTRGGGYRFARCQRGFAY